jgi:hypothetical protein
MLTVRTRQALGTKADVKSVKRRLLGNAVPAMIAIKLRSFAQRKMENGAF